MSTYPLTITYTSEYINMLSGADIVLSINKVNIVDYQAFNKTVRVYGLSDGGTALTSPTMTQDDYPDPGDSGTLSNSQIDADPADQWVVRLHLNDKRWEDIPMGLVSNEAGWVNTQAGADQCIIDLTA